MVDVDCIDYSTLTATHAKILDLLMGDQLSLPLNSAEAK